MCNCNREEAHAAAARQYNASVARAMARVEACGLGLLGGAVEKHETRVYVRTDCGPTAVLHTSLLGANTPVTIQMTLNMPGCPCVRAAPGAKHTTEAATSILLQIDTIVAALLSARPYVAEIARKTTQED